MNVRGLRLAILIIVAVGACSPGEPPDDRLLIEKIADDIETAVSSGDLMKVDKHLSLQAKQQGFEANKFLMDCSYGDSVLPEFTARTVKVMGDSAHLAFVLMPTGMQYSDSLPRSLLRLIKVDRWKIASFQLARNVQEVKTDSISR